jgi:hypothetical protein
MESHHHSAPSLYRGNVFNVFNVSPFLFNVFNTGRHPWRDSSWLDFCRDGTFWF